MFVRDGRFPDEEQTLTIRPPPCWAIAGAKLRISRIGPITWSSHWACQSASVSASSALTWLVPAPLTSASARPNAADYAFEQPLAGVRVGDVERDRLGVGGAAFAAGGRHLLERARIAADEHDGGAVPGQQEGGRGTDPARAARDHAHPPFETQIHARILTRRRWSATMSGAMAAPDPDPGRPLSFLFDLDGTLVDSVYQHVIAWREALETVGINLAVWKIHRRIGMSGGLFVSALSRELETPLDGDTIDRLRQLHADAYLRRIDSVRPLPGASELLAALTDLGVPWAIATSGVERYARRAVEMLGLPADTPLVTRDQVRYAKPDPDLFLTAAQRIGVDVRDSIVVGDSVWDLLAARRARAMGIGLLAGGYGREELFYAGAFRVYEDPRRPAHPPRRGGRAPPGLTASARSSTPRSTAASGRLP